MRKLENQDMEGKSFDYFMETYNYYKRFFDESEGMISTNL